MANRNIRSSRVAFSTGLPLALLIVLFVGVRHPFDAFRQNLYAVQLFRASRGILLEAPWVNGAWWNSLCDDHVAADEADANIHSSYWRAVYSIVRGNCDQAALDLSQMGISASTAFHNIVLAYTDSMLGRWLEAASLFPVSQIPPGNWSARRYWGNVLFRAGLLSWADSARLLEAERLLDSYRPDGSLALARFWKARGDPVAAFEEFRRALVGMKDSDVFALTDEYEMARRDYVVALAVRRPADAQLQRLALKYQQADGTHGDVGLEPLYALDHVLPDGRRLIGLTPDTDDLALGPLMRVTFYLLDSNALITETRWVRNRMPDASFTWSEPVTGVRPFGYGAQYGVKPPYPFQIERDGEQQYVCLDHDATNVRHSGLQSPVLPITTPWMVMVGRYRTAGGGKATVGVRWSGADWLITQHLVTGGTTPVWRSFAAVFETPAQAESVSGYLLQYQSAGRACFDDVLLFSLDLSS